MKKLFKYPFLAMTILTLSLASCGNSNDSVTIDSDTGTVEAVYTLTFDPCLGSNNLIREKGTTGTRITLPTAPSFGGYYFLGWSTSYDSSTKMGTEADILDATSYTIQESNEYFYGVYSVVSSHSQSEIDEYMESLTYTSEDNHLYYHYLRFNNTAESYADWDVWAWPYKPSAGEGAKFDWVGRTQSSDHLTASGDATIDDFGGAYVDIDLSQTYDGGWNNTTKTMGGTDVDFSTSTQVGLQIVQSSTRTSGSSFWTNDGSNLYITLEDYAITLNNGGTAYHVFVIQDSVQSPMSEPAATVVDPFADDDGTNTTYGSSEYDNVDWSSTASKVSTATDFEDVGVGYQIMVSSFADSDGDGFGDIYGITLKLDYLENLGVKVLWLTPIQLSDSYHGYDISDYMKVDPKFGSSASTASVQAGEVSSETALQDYIELLDAAHSRGMKVIMDLVINHTSTSNSWFIKSAQLDEEYRGYYQWGNHSTNSSQINEDNCWYPYGDHDYSYYAKFGSSMPELNYSYVSTREAIEAMSVYWARDIGVDGFRIDAVKHLYMVDEVSSTSGDTLIYDKAAAGDYSSDLTKNLNFFRELKSVVTEQSGKDVFFVGENFDGHAYHVAPYYEAFDSMFDFYSYYNLTSAAATGRTGSTSAYGTASGFMQNTYPYTISEDSNLRNGSDGIMSTANGNAWNFPAVYETYNSYRGDTSLPSTFTSNHDIARVINRIAGTGTAADGISEQGNVTTSDYASYEQSADCVKIAELMFPGITWIYYGDEIGMTGNFPSSSFTSTDDYADLYYRQPMKWSSSTSQDSDGVYNTDYSVTGSGITVGLDSVNSSSVVVPANTQVNTSGSEYNIMKTFAELKSGDNAVGQTLRVGSITATNYASGTLAANVLCFYRSYNGTTVKVAINFNSSSMSAYGLDGTVLATYNGASTSTLPAYSAIVVQA